MNFVVIGGDAAGMSAASRAKRSRPDMKVTVLERTRDVSYSACGMPYNIADPEREIDDLVVRQAGVFREKQGIDLRTGHRADRIDTKERIVSGTAQNGDSFQVPYDALLIATGASPVIPEIPGIDHPAVVALKTLQDGRRIRSVLLERKVRRAVVIGMGYIALEMVEALRARGIEADMVKPGPAFLPWLDPELAETVSDEVKKNGVRIHLGKPVKRIEEAGTGLSVVCDGLRLEADMVLVAAGISPNSRIAEEAGLALGPGRAVSVDRALRTSDAHIYGAGDCADAFHVVTGRKVWIPLALRANRAGWAVADNVCGTRTLLDGIAGTAVFQVFDLEVARTGLNAREATEAGFEPASVTIETRSRAHAHPGASPIRVHMVGDRQSGRLLGVFMTGKEGCAHRINAPAVALHAKMTVDRFLQSDLAYAPPFGPVWDPMLTAANQLVKKL